MNLTIVSGSHRLNSQSLKISNYLKEKTLELNLFDKITIIDLAQENIPFWDMGVWKEAVIWKENWHPIEAILTASNGFIFVTPEWGGMATPKLKNFFLLCTSKSIGHKPALIVSVSSELAGSFPVSELRASSYKNNKVCYIPDHLIIRNCKEVLNDASDSVVEESEKELRARIDFTLNTLREYSKVFQHLHIDLEKYPYGM
ncbi:MAG: NADPH-dependent FMN reductase [Saprospiraceae bacterium]